MSTVFTAVRDEVMKRPPEDRFPSWDALREAAATQRSRCRETEAVRDKRILFSENGTDVHFGEASLRLTPYALGQFAALSKVPMGVLQRLREDTRNSVLNQCLERTNRFKVGLVEEDRLRCVTGPNYHRVFDDEVLEAVDRWVIPAGFVPAVPTLGGGGEAALYRSDRSSFFFLFSTRDPKDSFGGLRKGICIGNSEVGHQSLSWRSFVFREVCSNYLVWGASGIVEQSAKHMGRVREVLAGLEAELRTISNAITPLEYSIVERAAKEPFVDTGDPADAARKLSKQFGVPGDIAKAAVEAAFLPANPGDLSTWGVVQGVTSVAKTLAYAEDRVALAATAGELLSAR